MRLDKFLTECGLGSRREVKEILNTGEITVNGIIANNPQMNIKENSDFLQMKFFIRKKSLNIKNSDIIF